MAIRTWKYDNRVANALVKTGPGVLHSVTLAAAADAATVIVYDNTSAAGSIIIKLSAELTGTAHALLDVSFANGLYVVVSGTTPSATLAYA